MAVSVIPAAIAGGLGAIQSAVGLINAGKAKKEAARLQGERPEIEASPYVNDALRLAESELAQGMSAQAQTAYQEGMDRDLSSSLSAVLRGGGSVNNIADVFDASAQGRQRFALMSENLRLNQLNNLARAQQMAENERVQRFEFNEWMPWADRAQATAAARAGAENQIWSGLNTMGGAAMSYFGQRSANNDYQNMLGGSGGGNVINPVPSVSVTAQQVPVVNSTPSPFSNINSINPNNYPNLQPNYFGLENILNRPI